MNPQIVIRILALLTLSSNVLVALYFIFLIVSRLGFGKKLFKKLNILLDKRAIIFAFIVALTATSGSLYLSEVALFEPCVFCWYQRILMYPLVFILGVALLKKRKDVWNYVLPISVFGLILASYHYKIQISPNVLIPCKTVGFSISCSERFFTHFGYITIPWMSLSAFTLVTILMFIMRKFSNRE